ncbi:MAG: 3'-5' exonuclease [Saprospirales bacterium]|nr:3'-5' exonuclease [Saprospirales bacterium]
MDWSRLFGKISTNQYPQFWLDYLDQNRYPPGKNTPLEEVCFVVFDTETTGLNPRTDKILSIGAVRVKGEQMDLNLTFERILLHENIPINKEAIGIHGILPGKSLTGREEGPALADFLSFIGNSILVGHHLQFDIAIVNEALRRHKAGKLKNPFLDTRLLAIRLEKGLGAVDHQPGQYSLDALCQRYQITPSDRHTAAGDAYLTAILLLKLLSRLKKRGVKTLGQLLR